MVAVSCKHAHILSELNWMYYTNCLYIQASIDCLQSGTTALNRICVSITVLRKLKVNVLKFPLKFWVTTAKSKYFHWSVCGGQAVTVGKACLTWRKSLQILFREIYENHFCFLLSFLHLLDLIIILNLSPLYAKIWKCVNAEKVFPLHFCDTPLYLNVWKTT